jgi:hydrogenase maturation protease
MTAAGIVVLGVGNTLMQDDGVGVQVVRALSDAYDWPPQVRLLDGGVAGFALLGEITTAAHLVIVDAVRGNKAPGAVSPMTPHELRNRQGPTISAHEVGLVEVLGMAELLGKAPRTVILGVQPGVTDVPGMDLTPPVREAVPAIVKAVVAELEMLGVKAVPKLLFRRLSGMVP